MGLEKIDVFKKERGLTNEELSKLSGVPKATIDKITSGATKDPKLETIKALVYCLGHTLDDLDDTKSAPEPVTTDSEAIRRMQLLINSFEAAGYVRPGEDLTDEQLRFCMALVDFLDTYFGRNT
jgi:transcriptional regulator with XRE-family HTH domain